MVGRVKSQVFLHNYEMGPAGVVGEKCTFHHKNSGAQSSILLKRCSEIFRYFLFLTAFWEVFSSLLIRDRQSSCYFLKLLYIHINEVEVIIRLLTGFHSYSENCHRASSL